MMEEPSMRDLERRLSNLEIARAADATDILWMRENLKLAKSEHNWKIATAISILTALIAVALELTRKG